MTKGDKSAVKTAISLTQNIFLPILSTAKFLLLFIALGFDNIIVFNNKITFQEVICTSSIATLPSPMNYSFVSLATCHNNTYVSVCKCERAHRLDLQYLVFSSPFI